jgi:hypothetical protein
LLSWFIHLINSKIYILCINCATFFYLLSEQINRKLHQ